MRDIDHTHLRLAGLGLLLALAGASAHARPPDGAPATKDVQAVIGGGARAGAALLKSALKSDDDTTWRVSHVIGSGGGDLFVAIGVATTATAGDAPEDWAGPSASQSLTPFAMVVRRTADAPLTLVAAAPLPTEDEPHADLGWGVAKMDDVDGDGRAELTVIYAYVTYYPGSTFAQMKRKQIAWLSVAPDGALAVQGKLVTAAWMGDLPEPDVERSFRFVPRGDARRDLRVTTREGESKTVALWSYDAARDTWTAPAAP